MTCHGLNVKRSSQAHVLVHLDSRCWAQFMEVVECLGLGLSSVNFAERDCCEVSPEAGTCFCSRSLLPDLPGCEEMLPQILATMNRAILPYLPHDGGLNLPKS